MVSSAAEALVQHQQGGRTRHWFPSVLQLIGGLILGAQLLLTLYWPQRGRICKLVFIPHGAEHTVTQWLHHVKRNEQYCVLTRHRDLRLALGIPGLV